MVELNLQIINFALTLRLVVLCYALLAIIHRVKMGLLNVNTDMSLKWVLPLCFVLVFGYFFGLRPSQQLFISSTDSPHKLLMAKLPTSSYSVIALFTRVFAVLIARHNVFMSLDMSNFMKLSFLMQVMICNKFIIQHLILLSLILSSLMIICLLICCYLLLFQILIVCHAVMTFMLPPMHLWSYLPFLLLVLCHHLFSY